MEVGLAFLLYKLWEKDGEIGPKGHVGLVPRYEGKGLFRVSRNEESRPGSFQICGSQAESVFQVTEANGYPFQLTVDKLEHALLRAKIEGKKVRGLVLINPQNPLGDVYSQDSMMEYLEFAKKYDSHPLEMKSVRRVPITHSQGVRTGNNIP